MKLGYKFNAVNIIRIALIVFALIRIATFIVYKGGYSRTEKKEMDNAREEANPKKSVTTAKPIGIRSGEERMDATEKEGEEDLSYDLCWANNYYEEKRDPTKTLTIEEWKKAMNASMPTIIQPSLWPTTTLLVPYIAIVVLIFMKTDIPPVLCLVNVTSILVLIYAGISCFLFSWICRTIPYMVIFEIVFFIEIAMHGVIIFFEVRNGMKKDGGAETSAPTTSTATTSAMAPTTAPMGSTTAPVGLTTAPTNA